MKERYTRKWLTLGEKDIIHVLPETDTQPHSTQTEGDQRELAEHNCPCQPKVSLEGTTYVIVHNSFQDKEYLDDLLEQHNIQL